MTRELAQVGGALVQIVRGRKRVLAWKDRLVELSRRSGQTSAAAMLEADLARPAFARKSPTLVLVMAEAGAAEYELKAAILVYEHRVLGLGSRLFISDYVGGAKTVIAPAAFRPQASFVAAEALMRQGALLVHISYEGEQPRLDPVEQERRAQNHRLSWAIWQRQTIGYIPLKDTVDATLADLGRHTRRNLRYYRRRADADLRAELIDHPQLTRAEFISFNRMCKFAIAEEQAEKRYDAIRHMRTEYLYLGLRTPGGEWLSLIGGRVEKGATYIEWQMNRDDMPSYSLCTVMRSHLIDHEVRHKRKKLYFVGGTTHSIRTALVPDVKIADLLALNSRLPKAILWRLSRPDSFVREMLSNSALEWHRWWRIPGGAANTKPQDGNAKDGELASQPSRR